MTTSKKKTLHIQSLPLTYLTALYYVGIHMKSFCSFIFVLLGINWCGILSPNFPHISFNTKCRSFNLYTINVYL